MSKVWLRSPTCISAPHIALFRFYGWVQLTHLISENITASNLWQWRGVAMNGILPYVTMTLAVRGFLILLASPRGPQFLLFSLTEILQYFPPESSSSPTSSIFVRNATGTFCFLYCDFTPSPLLLRDIHLPGFGQEHSISRNTIKLTPRLILGRAFHCAAIAISLGNEITIATHD